MKHYTQLFINIVMFSFSFANFAHALTLQQQVCDTSIKHQIIHLAKQSQFENSQQYHGKYLYSNTNSWLSLIDILSTVSCEDKLTLKTIVRIKKKLSNWHANNSEHPAIYFYPQLFSPLNRSKNKRIRLAVILPFDENYEKYSDQLLKLFLEKSKQNYWSINVYDSSQLNMETILDKIQHNEDTCIIGPLKKSNIKELARQGLHIPALALNTIGKKDIGHNYLFKTSISDDSQAFRLKQRLNQLDLHQGLLFYAKDKLPERELAASFLQQVKPPLYEWRQWTPINSQHKDYSHEIKDSLLINHSIQRYNKLHQLLNQEIEFVPRRRQDIDFIVASTSIQSLESLYPQFNFWFLENIPVFALINEKESLKQIRQEIADTGSSILDEDQYDNLHIFEATLLNIEGKGDFLSNKILFLGSQAIDIIQSTHCLTLHSLLQDNNIHENWSLNIRNKTFYIKNSN
ncbi:MAG: penicillin-binding protein activator [Gammaproteobacteria bacterium]|nr:penicillin-binding protein activator [Gammaproteobacteria bacterium]